MIRWATIVAKTPEWVELKLLQSGSCSGCTGQCNRPLFKLFSFQDNRFKLFSDDDHLLIINRQVLFNDTAQGRQVGQKVGLEINTDFMLSSAFQLYIIPLLLVLLGMTGGYLAAYKLALSTDLFTFLGLLLALAFVFLKQRFRLLSSSKTLPKVTIL